MSDAKAKKVSRIRFSSAVFPTQDDMALWNALSPAEKLTVVEQSEEAGYRSGVADTESVKDRLARVRAAYADAV